MGINHTHNKDPREWKRHWVGARGYESCQMNRLNEFAEAIHVKMVFMLVS